jgi:hypothetical protein
VGSRRLWAGVSGHRIQIAGLAHLWGGRTGSLYTRRWLLNSRSPLLTFSFGQQVAGGLDIAIHTGRWRQGSAPLQIWSPSHICPPSQSHAFNNLLTSFLIGRLDPHTGRARRPTVPPAAPAPVHFPPPLDVPDDVLARSDIPQVSVLCPAVASLSYQSTATFSFICVNRCSALRGEYTHHALMARCPSTPITNRVESILVIVGR